MLLTQDEAREKACRAPGALSFLLAEYGSKSPGDKIPEPRCIASDCMMWRNGPPTTEVHELTNELRNPELDRPEGAGWQLATVKDAGGTTRAQWWREIAKCGYCGLAGKPEA